MRIVSGNLLPDKGKLLGGMLLLLLTAMIFMALSMTSQNEFDLARREMLLRRIGHEMLLQSGDSTSRVLPVKKITANEYLLSFEKAFAFQPEALVQMTQQLLGGDPLSGNYVVNVLNCNDSSVAYGYAISGNKKDDIIACLGRKQPEACYLLNIRFQPVETTAARNGYVLGSLAILALIGYIFWRPAKGRRAIPQHQPAKPGSAPAPPRQASGSIFTLGSMSFDADLRQLMINEKTIDLTRTETRVLHIFAMAPNEPIARSRLQKEIWEDEGVIVGRSLDMFISKLRKKLEPDPNIKIAVIRGKGYKLEVNA